ncbi:hypothetical protein Hdeb2414_s0026g00682521 [Helianthus debilis subsp. tardiflorus]
MKFQQIDEDSDLLVLFSGFYWHFATFVRGCGCCDCDIVPVIENNGDILKLLRLTHVGGGYKSVFKGDDRVVEIPIDESHRFIYQPPAVV